MTRNSVVLVGLMGAGKTSIGRRLALRMGLPFRDADQEIEQAAGCTVAELFARFGEPAFREGERRVIQRLLAGPPLVLATGGGVHGPRDTGRHPGPWAQRLAALLASDPGAADLAQEPSAAVAGGDPERVLAGLMAQRHPIYAEADIVVDCAEDSPDSTTARVLHAVQHWTTPRRVPVCLGNASYDVVIGAGLIGRAGAVLAPVLPQKRCVVVTDSIVAELHLHRLLGALEEAAIEARHVVVPPGEGSKTLACYTKVTDALLEAGVERQTAVIALGGGVVGDLAGFAAATTLRGLPFVQIPTTLLAQVDSSVGGKTGINTAYGKNLLGAFHQPRIVLADTEALATLPPRELRAGYAEIAKAGLIGDAAFFAWCETNAGSLLGGEQTLQAEAVERACAFKADVVAGDEREEKASDGRALLNLGHTFAHALEAEFGYTGELLHGEAVAVGLGLAFLLSARLGHCTREDAARVIRHVEAAGLPAELGALRRRFSASGLIGHMQRDKKMRDGRLSFVLARGIGEAFTSREVPQEAVVAVLRDAGCAD